MSLTISMIPILPVICVTLPRKTETSRFLINSNRMDKNENATKVDMAKDFDKFSEVEKYFIKKVENLNTLRANDIKHLRKRNRFTGVLLGVGVFSVYFYTMYAVRQEKFLEGFDVVPDQKES